MNSSTRFSMLTLALVWGLNSLQAQPVNDSLPANIVASKATSDDGSKVAGNTHDGNPSSQWESTPLFPYDFFSRADQNLLLNSGSSKIATNSKASGLGYLTDGDLRSGAQIESNTASHWIQVNLPQQGPVHLISMKASIASGVNVHGIDANGSSQYLGTYRQVDNYTITRIKGGKNLKAIKLSSAKPFLLFELGAMAEMPMEDLVYEFDSIKTIRGLDIYFQKCNTTDSVHVDISEDGVSWNTIATPNPLEYFPKVYQTDTSVQGKFARVRFFIGENDYAHGKLKEISFFGDNYSGAGSANSDTTSGGGNPAPGNWDPLAGIYPAQSADAIITTATAENDHPISDAHDGDENTGWQSIAVLPAGYISHPNHNILTSKPVSITQCGGGSLPQVTDTDLKSGEIISSNTGNSCLSLDFARTQKVYHFSIKASNKSGDISIRGYLPNGDSLNLGTYFTTDNYKLKRWTLDRKFTGIKLVSQADFILFEVAATEGLLYEDVHVEFPAAREVGWVYTNFKSSMWIDSVHFDVSMDNQNWTTVVRPEFNHYFELAFEAQPLMMARYARLRIFLKQNDYAQAELYEFSIRDKSGTYGPMPSANSANRPLKDLMGLNGIRGWGHGIGSHGLDTTQGAYFYNDVATYGRNYQNLSWDTGDPDRAPNYNGMPGALATRWLNWDQEYDTWNAAGMDVQVSLQFTNSKQPENSWNNPWQAAYDIGYNFADHFGPTNGVGNVKALEIGNEPWDYGKDFYRTVLNGMAQGAKDADPNLKVFSGALQAAHPSQENGSSGNFIGERLTETEAPYLDGINAHHYSYKYDNATKQRVATYPEDPLSTFRGILSDLRFRNHNMPGAEVHITEWGWGSDGAGQGCSSPECVPEYAQAIYAARGLFMMDRLGVDRAMYYFYANLPGGWGSKYSRSGLTGPIDYGSVKKKSFFVFETIMDELGDSYFLQVLNEDDNAWAYLYGDAQGNPSHVVAWRPVDESNSASYQLALNLGYNITSAIKLDGTPGGKAVSLPATSNSSTLVSVSATPVLLTLNNAKVTKSTAAAAPPMAGDAKLELYPNPSSGQFKMDFELPEDTKARIKIYSLDGRLIETQEHKLYKGSETIEFNLDNLPAGYYLIETNLTSAITGAEQQFRNRMLITE